MKFARIGREVVDESALVCLSNLVVESGLVIWIKAAQLENLE